MTKPSILHTLIIDPAKFGRNIGSRSHAVLVGLATISALTHSPNANAMNWCGILNLIPSNHAEFDKMAPQVEAATGCLREASDSAHKVAWQCADEASTPEVNESVRIIYLREPTKTVHMLISGVGMTDLNVFRTCGDRSLRDEATFSPGNVALRDQLALGHRAVRLTLTNIIPDDSYLIVSNPTTYSGNTNTELFWEGFHGIRVESAPFTAVRLAGVNPLTSNVKSIVAAYRSRGAEIKDANDVDGLFPQWKLTPPTGLAGVKEVSIRGFVKHLLDVEYVLESTPDYQRYIDLLDEQYSISRRVAEKGCTTRFWTSGRMTIRGEHCPGKGDTLRFFNDVASDQLAEVAAKMEAENSAPNRPTKKATIDRDML